MPYSEELMARAKNASIRDALDKVGIDYKETGGGYISFKLPNFKYDFYATPKNYYANRAGEKDAPTGSGAIKFLMDYEDIKFIEAVEMLVGPPDIVPREYKSWKERGKEVKQIQVGKNTDLKPVVNAPEPQDGAKRGFVLPKEPTDELGRKRTKDVFAYLNQTRKIDPDVINAWMRAGIVREMVVERPGKKPFYNVMFVGYDDNKRPAHAAIRGLHDRSDNGTNTSYRGEAKGSDKNYSARWIGSSKTVRVYESTIDAMSWCSMHKGSWENYSHVVLNGVSPAALRTFLKKWSESNVIVALDNDEAGIGGFEQIKDMFIKDFPNCRLYRDVTLEQSQTGSKDWNELLKIKEDRKLNGESFEVEDSYYPVEVRETPELAKFDFSNGTIYGIEPTGDVVWIPERINGEPVTSIGMRAFENLGVREVAVPSTLTRIEYAAFAGCASLATISGLEATRLETIGGSAFLGCLSLKDVSFPDSLHEIGDKAFLGCSSLEKVNLPDSVERLGNGAFAACVGLKEAVISNSLKTIGEDVFRSCTGLEQVEFPESIRTIEDGAFATCVSLKEIKLPNHVTVGKSFPDAGVKTVISNDSVHLSPEAFARTDYQIDRETNEVREVSEDRRSEIEFLTEKKEITEQYTDGPTTERSVPFREERTLSGAR